ncbi:Alpha/Beta hydrolase protein [Spinellus fusiger]|nr:Alpha/Beta hydrolase protein [Spinellus fusiger]
MWLLWLLSVVLTASAQSLTPLELITLPRPGTVSASPNGHFAVYTESTYHQKQDKTTRQLYLLDLQTNLTRALTHASFEVSQTDVFFLDNHHIAYLQHSAKHPVSQLHVSHIDTGVSYRLSNFPIETANFKYNPTTGHLVFSAQVYPGSSMEKTKERDQEIESAKRDTGVAYDQLMIRHWDSDVTDKINNLFVVKVKKDDQYFLSDKITNLFKGTDLQCPGFPSGDASDYDLSFDGKSNKTRWVAFVAKIRSSDNAWQTSQHLYIVPTSGEEVPIALNDDIPAASSAPVFSQDGTLLYLQMYTAKDESDLNRIIHWSPITQKKTAIAKTWDRSPSTVKLDHNTNTVYAVAQDHGHKKLFSIDIVSDTITALTHHHSVAEVILLSSSRVLLSINGFQFPNWAHLYDIHSQSLQRLSASGPLTEHLGRIAVGTSEEFEFEGAMQERVHGWIAKPADFDASRHYPVAFLIHGGPQSAWDDGWSTRWNPQVFASQQYIVVSINFHGSTGYGHAFTNAIRRQWGSHPYVDLMKGLDYVLAKHSYMDADRVVALGASYGGYMINWLNGHTHRFKAMVNHDGLFSPIGMYYSTEELYFPEFEFGGAPYHPLSRLVYERWSPANFVHNWKTPTLVVQGMYIHLYEIHLYEIHLYEIHLQEIKY